MASQLCFLDAEKVTDVRGTWAYFRLVRVSEGECVDIL